ncbi:MAG: hypothetical protein ACE5D3_03085, partial [Candidatus Binatia bacterium]
GCVNVANTASCDDGDPCTVGDLCAAGACAGGALAPDCRSLSPVNQALVPCDPTVLDRYVFDVVAGEDVLISADTVDSVTAADLAFDGNCGSSVFFSGDDEIVCTFPPPTFDCPETSFVAVASGTCTVDVTEATFDCTDPARANYVLTIVRDGQPALITLVNDNVPN